MEESVFHSTRFSYNVRISARDISDRLVIPSIASTPYSQYPIPLRHTGPRVTKWLAEQQTDTLLLNGFSEHVPCEASKGRGSFKTFLLNSRVF